MILNMTNIMNLTIEFVHQNVKMTRDKIDFHAYLTLAHVLFIDLIIDIEIKVEIKIVREMIANAVTI